MSLAVGLFRVSIRHTAHNRQRRAIRSRHLHTKTIREGTAVTQQPHHTQPGQPPAWGQPGPYGPPPPKKGMSTGAIVAIVIGSVFAFLVLLGVIVGGDDSTQAGDDKAPTRSSAPAKGAPKPAAPAKEEPAEKAPVTITAKKTAFAPSVLHQGGAYTSVSVTIANSGDKDIDVNPLYFTITDTTGSKHTAELGMDEGQIATVKLAPGEKVTGTVTGKGKFAPKYVTYVDGLFGDGVRGSVS